MTDSNVNKRIRRFSLIGFLVALGLVQVFIVIPMSRFYVLVLGVPTFVLMCAFGTTFVGTIAVREIINLKQTGWRFSLRTLLFAMTLVAMVLGWGIYVLRN
jgi:hypothetical protein